MRANAGSRKTQSVIVRDEEFLDLQMSPGAVRTVKYRNIRCAEHVGKMPVMHFVAFWYGLYFENANLQSLEVC